MQALAHGSRHHDIEDVDPSEFGERSAWRAARFADRRHAGRLLAQRLHSYARRADVIVLALPRGGVPVGFEVAMALEVPLDVLVVRKLGVPGHRELAMGAISSHGTRVLNEDVIASLGISAEVIEAVTREELGVLRERERAYRGDREPVRVRARSVIVVDDGIATGATVRAALRALRSQEPARIAVAVPVSAESTRAELMAIADDVVCVVTPEMLFAVGQWYVNFSETTDVEVRTLLDRVRHEQPLVAWEVDDGA